VVVRCSPAAVWEATSGVAYRGSFPAHRAPADLKMLGAGSSRTCLMDIFDLRIFRLHT
jgi:hypothetical protein